jgi:hypothetical protein
MGNTMSKPVWSERDKAVMQFSSDLLEIMYAMNDETTSDLQGAIEAKVMQIMSWNPVTEE